MRALWADIWRITATWALDRMLTSASSNSVPKDSSAVFSTLATADFAAAAAPLRSIIGCGIAATDGGSVDFANIFLQMNEGNWQYVMVRFYSWAGGEKRREEGRKGAAFGTKLTKTTPVFLSRSGPWRIYILCVLSFCPFCDCCG